MAWCSHDKEAEGTRGGGGGTMVARSDQDKEADGHWEDSHIHVAVM